MIKLTGTVLTIEPPKPVNGFCAVNGEYFGEAVSIPLPYRIPKGQTNLQHDNQMAIAAVEELGKSLLDLARGLKAKQAR